IKEKGGRSAPHRGRFAPQHWPSQGTICRSKEEHDACRKFPNGEGSFDIIINNIKKFEEKYPEYVKEHVRFMTTVNPYMNLGCVLEYFKTSDVINDTKITYNGMSESNLKEE